MCASAMACARWRMSARKVEKAGGWVHLCNGCKRALNTVPVARAPPHTGAHGPCMMHAQSYMHARAGCALPPSQWGWRDRERRGAHHAALLPRIAVPPGVMAGRLVSWLVGCWPMWSGGVSRGVFGGKTGVWRGSWGSRGGWSVSGWMIGQWVVY